VGELIIPWLTLLTQLPWINSQKSLTRQRLSKREILRDHGDNQRAETRVSSSLSSYFAGVWRGVDLGDPEAASEMSNL
jgi:hypothetical protein